MSEHPGTCEYVLDPYDPSTWGGEEEDWCYVEAELNEDGVWPCPHDAVEDGELCVFHLPPEQKDDDEVTAAFVDALDRAAEADDGERGANDDGTRSDAETRQPGQEFLGARFGTFDVRGRTLAGAGDAPLNLKHARFDGEIDGEETVVEPRLRLDGATVAGGAYFRGTTVEKDVSLRGVTVENGIDFGGATVASDADLREAAVTGGVHFRNATVGGEANFGGMTVDGETYFPGTTIEGGADFSGANLGGGGDFRGATIGDGADFEGVTVAGRADFREATVAGGADFRELDLEATLFRDATMRDADFSDADLTDANFSDADLRGANLERATLNRAGLFDADLRGATLYGASVGDATINEGTTFGDRCPYDPAFDPTSEGETTPDADDDVGADSEPDVDDEQGADSEHDADDDSGVDQLTRAAGAYRLVEGLARANAFPGRVSHSFVRRHDVYRRQYYDDGAYVKWAGKWVSRLVLLYGESWRRIVTTSAAVVLVFALLYPLGGWMAETATATGDGTRLTYDLVASDPLAFGRSLYYSTLTFASLGFGDFRPVGPGQALATVETVLGTVLFALLVFVFGRRGTR